MQFEKNYVLVSSECNTSFKVSDTTLSRVPSYVNTVLLFFFFFFVANKSISLNTAFECAYTVLSLTDLWRSTISRTVNGLPLDKTREMEGRVTVKQRCTNRVINKKKNAKNNMYPHALTP